jgi:FdhD protein
MERVIGIPITRVGRHAASAADDAVAIEEPLEIRVGDKPLCVTMRTPGDDFDLATGFLITECIIPDARSIESIRHWGSPNLIRVTLRDDVRVDLQRLQRHFYATSSCGICGKASIDAIRVHTRPLDDRTTVTREVVDSLPAAVRRYQTAFDATGGLHAAALFTPGGELLSLREDIGRHNAVDKVIGARGGETPSSVLLVSGRAGFEVVQKAVVARIPIVAAVGAPSSLAVDLARQFDLTLLGFVRDGRFNVYAGRQRLLAASSGTLSGTVGGPTCAIESSQR